MARTDQGAALHDAAPVDAGRLSCFERTCVGVVMPHFRIGLIGVNRWWYVNIFNLPTGRAETARQKRGQDQQYWCDEVFMCVHGVQTPRCALSSDYMRGACG